jgi:hypothetical protein
MSDCNSEVTLKKKSVRNKITQKNMYGGREYQNITYRSGG